MLEQALLLVPGQSWQRRVWFRPGCFLSLKLNSILYGMEPYASKDFQPSQCRYRTVHSRLESLAVE